MILNLETMTWNNEMKEVKILEFEFDGLHRQFNLTTEIYESKSVEELAGDKIGGLI